MFRIAMIAGLSLAVPCPILCQEVYRVSAVLEDDQLFVLNSIYTEKKNSYGGYLARGSLVEINTSRAQGNFVSYSATTQEGSREAITKICINSKYLWGIRPGNPTFGIIANDDLYYFEDTEWSQKMRILKFGKNEYLPAYSYSVDELFFANAVGEEERLLEAL